MSALRAIFLILRGLFRSRAALENLALRQQLAVLRRSVKRPRLRPRVPPPELGRVTLSYLLTSPSYLFSIS